MHFTRTVTGDGVATLAAGIIAFCAVWWQVRSSTSNLQKQLDAEKRAREEYRERQNRAVTRAILFEVDSLYRYHVRDVYKALKDDDPATCKLFGIKSISAQPFPVYNGNGGSLGALDDEVVGAIVGFYSTADAYLCTLRDYKTESERYYYSSDLVAEEKARTFLKQIKDAAPELTTATFLVCTKLCEKANVEFRFPTIAVAAQDLSIDKIAVSLKGPDGEAH